MKYPLISRIIHWVMAALILTLLGLGIYMVNFLSKESPYRSDIYTIHKLLGVIVLIMVFVRIVNRLINRPPALPTTLPKYEIILAHLTHYIIYLLMVLVPLTGYLMANAFGFPVLLFGLPLPILMHENFEIAPLIHDSHWVLAYTLIFFLGLHIAGVIKHRLFDKPENDVLRRML